VAMFSDTTLVLNAAAFMVTKLHEFLSWCGSLSWAAMDWPSPGGLRVTLASVGVAIALGSVLKGNLKPLRHLGWLTLLLLWKTPDPSPPPGQMEVVFIDVGQGSSVLVRTHQHHLLYDTGPSMGDSDAGARMVMPVLRRFGIRRIDHLMISHFDNDHSGGLASVLAGMPVTTVSSPEPPPAETVQMQRQQWRDQPRFQSCQAGQKWQWDGVHFEVLFPDPQDIVALNNRKRPDRNAMSCVLRIQAAQGESLLLAGDIPAEQETWLAQRFDRHRLGALNDLPDHITHNVGAGLASTVLLAPHHGSKTSTSATFLHQVQPQVVVVQSGYRNRYGHPHQQVLDRIPVQVLRTDLQGQIRLRWEGGLQVEDFWAGHRRYWHQQRSAGIDQSISRPVFE
jgi:competence protein ComEC